MKLSLEEKLLETKLQTEVIDVTLPGRTRNSGMITRIT